MKRRKFLKKTLCTQAAAFLGSRHAAASSCHLHIALLHLAPVPRDLEGNRRLVEKAISDGMLLGRYLKLRTIPGD
jgi:hypothetical protein